MLEQRGMKTSPQPGMINANSQTQGSE